MKKLVLLVSVFLLMAGMVAAQVSFAPVVTGTTSVTWGMDLTVGDNEMNSGFDTDSATSLDLGVVIDPMDAKGGDGIYGEVTMTGLSVTAKGVSGDDPVSTVEVAAPAIDAKLWFSEAMYAFIDSDGLATDYAAPLGEFKEFAAGNDISGTWYDDGDTVVFADYGNAGYGFTYMAGDLTATLSFVSNDKWGTTGDDDDNQIDATTFALLLAVADVNASTTIDSPAELTALNGLLASIPSDNTYVIKVDYVLASGEYVFITNDDGEYLLNEYDEDGDFVEETYDIEFNTSTVNSSLYTAGIDVAYTLTDVGTFKAYVAPAHESATKLFNIINFGAMANIALADFDMVGLTVSADMIMDNSTGVADEDKFDFEVAVTVPVMVGDMLTANFKAFFTDAESAGDNLPLDLSADATLMAAGATVKGAYIVTDFAEDASMAQMYKLSASYPVAVADGTVTPMIAWEQDMKTPWDALTDQKGILTLSAVAEVVENTTFTLKYKSGNMLIGKTEAGDMGLLTFETKFAY